MLIVKENWKILCKVTEIILISQREKWALKQEQCIPKEIIYKRKSLSACLLLVHSCEEMQSNLSDEVFLGYQQ